MARIGFSQRKTVLYLYAWTLLLAGVAVALRLVPYHDHGAPHHYHTGWAIVMAALGVFAIAASVYLVYVLEIFKLKSLRASQMRTIDPDTSEHEIDAQRPARARDWRVRNGGIVAPMQIPNLDDLTSFTTLDGSAIRELAGPAWTDARNQSLAEATVPAGGETAEHYHPRTEELYYFTAGRGRMRLGDEEADVRRPATAS